MSLNHGRREHYFSIKFLSMIVITLRWSVSKSHIRYINNLITKCGICREGSETNLIHIHLDPWIVKIEFQTEQ